MIRQVIRRLLPYKDITAVARIDTPLTPEMQNALDIWYDMYRDQAPWLKPDTVKSMGIPAFIASEIARQVTLEVEWNITGKGKGTGGAVDDAGEPITNPRSEYLKTEFKRCMDKLRPKLEHALAAGGMVIKPYPKDGHIFFDFTPDWSIYPIAFDDDGNLSDVIFRDSYTVGKTFYTRLERHTVEGDNVKITQKAYKSMQRDAIGTEVPLSAVPAWEKLEPEALIKNAEGEQLFGWYKVASANNVELESPLGASIYSKACDLIRDADEQYSRLLWEFEGSELAVDVDPQVLKPRKTAKDGKVEMVTPRLNERLFRGVDLGADETYHVFAPPIRDESLLKGLNAILVRVENSCGLARGMLADVNLDARTATEIKILKQRFFATVSDNQKALEDCLRSVVHAMDEYATLYDLVEPGEYELTFDWDDSVISDKEQQTNERLSLLNVGAMSKAELREWYFGETPVQATAAVEKATEERLQEMAAANELVAPPVVPE